MTGWSYGPWESLTEAELKALPVGTLRTFDLRGVRLSVMREHNGFRVVGRRNVPAHALANSSSAAQVPVPEHVEAMAAVAKPGGR